MPGYYEPPPTVSPLAVVSLVLGILSVLFALLGLCCFLGLPGIPLGIAAAVCGHLALRQVRHGRHTGRGPTLVGLITGYAGAALALVLTVVYVIVIIVSAASSGGDGGFEFFDFADWD